MQGLKTGKDAEMTVRAQLKNGAGGIMLAAGVVLIIAQALFYFAIDSSSIAATVKSPGFVYYNALNILGAVLLLAGLYGWSLQDSFGSGRFALFRFFLALIGTLFLFGDIWFESFAVPSSVQTSPELLDLPPGRTLVAGILVSAALFKLGWFIIGVHITIKGKIKRWYGVILALSCLYGVLPLVFPHLLPFAIAIGLIGYHLQTARSRALMSKADEIGLQA